MPLLDSLDKFKQEKPVILLLGVYDGVHKGHQALIKKAKEIAALKKTKVLLITFKNSPAQVLFPERKVELLCPFPERVRHLQKYGIDIICPLEFKKELARLTAKQFFEIIAEKIPFTDLVIGFSATIGSDQKNNRANILKAAEEIGFRVVEHSPVLQDKLPITSSRIRDLIAKKSYNEAEALLGHSLDNFKKWS